MRAKPLRRTHLYILQGQLWHSLSFMGGLGWGQYWSVNTVLQLEVRVARFGGIGVMWVSTDTCRSSTLGPYWFALPPQLGSGGYLVAPPRALSYRGKVMCCPLRIEHKLVSRWDRVADRLSSSWSRCTDARECLAMHVSCSALSWLLFWVGTWIHKLTPCSLGFSSLWQVHMLPCRAVCCCSLTTDVSIPWSSKCV